MTGLFFRNDGGTAKLSARVRESDLARLHLGENPFQECTSPEENLPAMSAAAALSGVFSITPDPDTLLRRYTLAFSHDGVILPSLGLQMLRLHFNKDVELSQALAIGLTGTIAGLALPLDSNGTVRLNYSKRGSIPTVSFADVATGVVSPAFFKGKLVVVGVSEAGVTDIRPTPLGNIPGPWVHCTFLSNILQGDALRDSMPLAILTLALALSLPVLAGITTLGALGRLVVTVSTGATVIGICLYARARLGVYVDYYYALAGLAGSFGLQQALLLRDQEGRLRFAHTLKTHDVTGFQLEHHESAGVILPIEGVTSPNLLVLAARTGGFAVADTCASTAATTDAASALSPAELVGAINAFTATVEAGVKRLHGVVLPPRGEFCVAVFEPTSFQPAGNATGTLATVADFALALAGEAALPSAPAAAQGPTVLLASGNGTLGRLGGTVLQVYTGFGSVFDELAELESLARHIGPGIYATPACAAGLAGHLAHEIPVPPRWPERTARTWLRVLPATPAGRRIAADFTAAVAALATNRSGKPDDTALATRRLDDCIAYHFDGAARLLRDGR